MSDVRRMTTHRSSRRRATDERRDDHRAGSRAAGAAAGAARDPLRGAARCADRAARAGLPGPDPRRRPPASTDRRRGGDRQDLLAASVGRWPRRRRASGRRLDGAHPRCAATSGRAPRSGDGSDERSAGRSRLPGRAAARRLDRQPDGAARPPRAVGHRRPERRRCRGAAQVVRPTRCAQPAGVGGDYRRTGAGDREGHRPVPRVDRQLPPGARGRHGGDDHARRRLRRFTAARVQPTLRHRGSPRRRPRRAHVAARQPRRHRWPCLPAPGDADQQPRRHVHQPDVRGRPDAPAARRRS